MPAAMNSHAVVQLDKMTKRFKSKDEVSCNDCMYCPPTQDDVHPGHCVCALPQDYNVWLRNPAVPASLGPDPVCGNCKPEKNPPPYCHQMNCMCDAAANWCKRDWFEVDSIWKCSA